MSDSTTQLDQIDRTAANSDVMANANFDAGSTAMAYGRRAKTCVGLTFGGYGVRNGGTLIANWTVTLSASSISYAVMERATGAVSFDTATTDWDDTSAFARLYKITTGTSTVTAYEDHRFGAGGLISSGISSALADGTYGEIEVTDSGTSMEVVQTVLALLKGLTPAANKGIQFTGAGSAGLFDLTAAGKALLDDADAAAQRATLGLGTAALLTSDTDTTLAANSDTRTATQKAVKTYIDGIITGGASDVMLFRGVIDCSANPNYPAADAGNVYKVSVAGKIGGAAGPNVEVGDTVYCITDATSAGNHATVGTNWVITQVNIDGAVVGPASVTSGNLSAFDGTTGKLIKELTPSQVRTLLALVIGTDVQAYDADLTTIAGLTATTDNFMQAKAGAWASRTPAQVRADLGEKVQALTDGATISVDASLGNNCRVTLGGNRTLANPSNLIDGQPLNFRISQDGTGTRTLAYGSKYKFPGGTAPVLSTAASSKDLLCCVYDATDDTLFCVLSKAFA